MSLVPVAARAMPGRLPRQAKRTWRLMFPEVQGTDMGADAVDVVGKQPYGPRGVIAAGVLRSWAAPATCAAAPHWVSTRTGAGMPA